MFLSNCERGASEGSKWDRNECECEMKVVGEAPV